MEAKSEGVSLSNVCLNFPNIRELRRRTFHEPTQIIKSTPVDSDVEFYSPNFIWFEPKQIERSTVYALGSEHEKFYV